MHTVPFLGKDLPLTVTRIPFPMPRILEKGGTLQIQVPGQVSETHLPSAVGGLVHRWLTAQARHHIVHRVRHHAKAWGLDVGRVTVKDTRSRWGSCSRTGNLNFSWRLVMAPEWILDYVVIHELAHLREMNHSSRFWALVAERCPDYRSHVQWLKVCGDRLFAVSFPVLA